MLDHQHEPQSAGDGRQHLNLYDNFSCPRPNTYLFFVSIAQLIFVSLLNTGRWIWVVYYDSFELVRA